ncbi:hypothetical protein AB0L88_42070 [Saccharopolyspora shandongensis]
MTGELAELDWDLVRKAHEELAVVGEDLPPYHRAAQASATLLHRETG